MFTEVINQASWEFFFHRLYAVTSFWYLRRRPLVANRENAATSSYRPGVSGCGTNIKALWWKWHVTGWFHLLVTLSGSGFYCVVDYLYYYLEHAEEEEEKRRERGREGRGGVGSPKLVNNTGSCNKLPAQHWHSKFAIDLSVPAWAEQLNLEIQQREQW